jgi:hypothetical protein
MTEKEPKPKAEADTPTTPNPAAKATPPRGNPERDHESVEKGKEQLGKITGN